MTDLTDRMRTCAAYLLTTQLVGDNDAVKDAAELLIEASNELQPVETIPPPPPGFSIDRSPSPMWRPPFPHTDVMAQAASEHSGIPAGHLPPPPVAARVARAVEQMRERERSPSTCPKCDSRAAKKVYREARKLMLACPVCGERWQYKPKAEWT
jgi:ribosomal protein L37AE/L43A